MQFFVDRLKVIYKEEGVAAEIFEAVRAVAHTDVTDFDARISAVIEFKTHPACERLAQSNKRVANILNKNNVNQVLSINKALLQEPAEFTLFEALTNTKARLESILANTEYKTALMVLSQLDQPIADFFEHIMVIAEDESVKNNRLALLQQLSVLFKQVAALAVL